MFAFYCIPNSISISVHDSTAGKDGGSWLLMYFSLTNLNSYVDPSTYYVEANQSGSSPESSPKHILYHNFSEMQKNKKIQLGKYTGSMRSIQKCIKIDLFPIIGSTDFFPKRCRQVVRSLLVAGQKNFLVRNLSGAISLK